MRPIRAHVRFSLRRVVAVAATLFLVAGCGTLAVWSAPAKTRSASRTPAAVEADKVFWRTLHGGEYAQIPTALTALKGAYLADPNDPVTAAHIGFMHIWRLSERGRIPGGPGPEITDDAVLARKYFEEAVRLDPSDARYAGFYAALLMSEGTIHKDDKLVRRGYYAMKDGVRAWPEFNLFTSGYAPSQLPHDSTQFAEALQAQWKNLDLCIGERIDRANPDYAKYMRLERREGPKRACWNSWIAPHNLEGFFLSFGDMLVKAGQPDAAVVMYGNARLPKEYATWPYRPVLEERIASAKANVEAFRVENPPAGAPTVMVRSTFACMACHQE